MDELPGEPRRVRRLDLLPAAKFYALGAVLHFVMLLVSDIPAVNDFFMRLGWWLSPYWSLPFPYSRSEPYAVQSDYEWHDVLGFSLLAIFALTLVIALLHLLTVLCVLLLHSWFGWPRYWRDVRSRMDLESLCHASARSCWWLWPAGQLLWIVLDKMSWWCRYANAPLIMTCDNYLAANVFAIAVIYAWITGRLVRERMAQVVGLEDHRCWQCGYLLRGLPEARCPECGYHAKGQAGAEYGLRWERFRTVRRVRLPLRMLFLPAMLLAPVWVPLVVRSIPPLWLWNLPDAVRPNWALWPRNTNQFPIRSDAVVVIRRRAGLAVIRFEPWRRVGVDYQSGYWFAAEDFGARPPDIRMSGRLVGNGSFSPRRASWGFEYMVSDNVVWLTRPDETYEIEAFERHRFPGDLSWLDSPPQTAPASAPADQSHVKNGG